MTLGFFLLGAALLLISLIQVKLSLSFLRSISGFRGPVVKDEDLPQAAIVLALRGADPFIDECLHRLGNQDYPRYRIHVIVDHPQDEVVGPVAAWRKAHPGLDVTLEFLRDPSDHCPLYGSALHQAIVAADPETEVIAFANADTMPHRHWLRSLVAPLTLEDVGACTGNRWFLPQLGGIGGLVRYVQNASALMIMERLGLMWGGSLAIRRSVFTSPVFLHRLRNACCEDHAIHEALRANGERLFSTPAVLMVNREECTFVWGFRFLRRQLLWTRLYHPRAHELSVHALVVAALAFLVPVCLGLAFAAGDWWSLGWISAGAGIAFLVNVFVLWRTHTVVMNRVRADQGDAGGLPSGLWPKLLMALPLTLCVYIAAAFSAWRLREVEWRGIRYVVVPRGLRRVSYQPYKPEPRNSAPLSL